MYKYKIEKRVLKKQSEAEGQPIRKGRRLVRVEQDFKRHMLRFKKKEVEMRKFDNATEVTFLSKGIDKLSEVIDGLEEDQKKMQEKQDEVFQLLHFLILK